MMIVLYLINMGSTAALLGVFLVVSFTGEWFGRWNLAKARKKVRTKGTTSMVTMNDQGIDMEGANGNSHLKWSAMLQPAIYPDGVLIKFSRFAVVWLPDQALIDGSPADVRRLLSENVKDPSHPNQQSFATAPIMNVRAGARSQWWTLSDFPKKSRKSYGRLYSNKSACVPARTKAMTSFGALPSRRYISRKSPPMWHSR
jgi:hypothetical protein